MSDEMRLARVDLGPGWIDLGYGEPVVVQEILHKHVPTSILPQAAFLHSQYQPPKGNKELVDFLEKKYGAHVVVTNGAKQGIAAVSYALKKLGHKDCVIHSPYWTSTPSIISDVGLNVHLMSKDNNVSGSAFMLTTPNNPDGWEVGRDRLLTMSKDASSTGVALIHDAAYYTPIYMEKPEERANFGDAQIYSFSKMYGLSGLRIGYVVVHNDNLLPHVIEFVERSCSGVSTASQQVALAVESFFADNPSILQAFEQESRVAIAASRVELEALLPDALVPEPCASNSMFAWCKTGPKLNAVAAKVNVLSGDMFGKPGMTRLNIALKSDLIKTAVERLNAESLKP